MVPRPAVMPSGIQPEGRSILDGNGDAAAAGAANAPRAIATANRIVRGRRVISNLPWRWGRRRGGVATDLVTARCVRLSKPYGGSPNPVSGKRDQGLDKPVSRCTLPTGYITK